MASNLSSIGVYNHAYIFQAEIYAILEYVVVNLQKRYINHTLTVRQIRQSDSPSGTGFKFYRIQAS